MTDLSPERRDELAGTAHDELCHHELAYQECHAIADRLAPLIAGWLAEAEWRGADIEVNKRLMYDDRMKYAYDAGAAEVRARVEAVLERVEDVRQYGERQTPYRNGAEAMGRKVRKALNGGESDA